MMKPVLLVDDNPLDLEAAVCLLRRSRILNPLFTFDNGGAVINYLSGKNEYTDRNAFPYPVLVLLDFKMTGICGTEVLRWMKQTGQPVKVVVMTGLDIQHVKECYALGAQSFLSKPLDPDEFSNLIKRLPGLALRVHEHGIYLEAAGQ